jgi:hypothetical protein
MQAPTTAKGARVLYQEHDRIPIPEDVPELGIRRGDEGVIRRLTYLRNTVFAFVMVTYSTGQLRGWVVSRGDKTGEKGPLLHDGLTVGRPAGRPCAAPRGT